MRERSFSLLDFAPSVQSVPSVAAMSGQPACPGQAWVGRDGRCHMSAVSAQWRASQALTPLHFWSMTVYGVRVWCHGATCSMLLGAPCGSLLLGFSMAALSDIH